MKIYEFKAKQELPISQEEAWEFLSNPKNLQKIMPSSMGFQIVSGANQTMYAGQIIQYKVTPLPGFKTKWVTEITQVKKPFYFVDIQLDGPYKLWHHKHFIHPTDQGVIIEDIVHYAVPFGWLGSALHPFIIRPKLEEIFTNRVEKMNQLFK
ncbi:SRPBCC family protein [Psychroflexus maritimus]|uniref:SRPBCC family protein n=1 Tax=Psychroflexus maritimus TaxID=2714865 RepID=A0A967ADF7_9FLAO|nr:SRPBCC family protein [Psychroflexus maritimus]NGZ89263.1 SRPBCC family protein [Psychroflexus maritimus]